jgi:hypothetical protein
MSQAPPKKLTSAIIAAATRAPCTKPLPSAMQQKRDTLAALKNRCELAPSFVKTTN